VPFTELRSAPFNLQFLDTVKAKFNAFNVIGQGEYSQPNAEGSFIEVEPQAVRGITLDPAISDTTSVHITWTHLYLTVETGASPVLNYLIKTDQGTGVWADFDQTVASATPSFTITGLTPGQTYKFRVVAENLHGFGPEGEDFETTAAD